MNDNARKLVAALRSGEFEQADGRLRDGDKFCCLGVACELYRREVGGEWERGRFLGQFAFLPPVVQEWLGFDQNDGLHDGSSSLAEMNDDGRTFAEIAAEIEAEPEGMFR